MFDVHGISYIVFSAFLTVHVVIFLPLSLSPVPTSPASSLSSVRSARSSQGSLSGRR